MSRGRPIKNIAGQRFGRLTVLDEHESRCDPNGTQLRTYWKCKCDCGNEIFVAAGNLVSGNTISCGCYRNDVLRNQNKLKETPTIPNNFKGENLAGRRFGRLIVLPHCESHKTKHGVSIYWKCKCDCGNEKFVQSRHLKNGNTTSCGCYRAELAANAANRSKWQFNRYDTVSKPYGIGYCTNVDVEFYFDLDDFNKIKCYNWFYYHGYIATHTKNNRILLMHNLLLSPSKNEYVNHIHGVESAADNRKSNLRLCDKYETTWNKPIRATNTSGTPGVTYNNGSATWIASITYRGTIVAKSFKTKEEAINQRKAWEEEYYGEYSYDNSQAVELK